MTNSYDNQTLRSYLLGSLPEADTDRLDEMTFVDPDFAEVIGAAEKDLVDDYVNGELDGETLGKFEAHYLASPIRRKKVNFARALGKFAEREILNEKGPATAEEQSERTGWFSKFFASLGLGTLGSPAIGFAAVAAALLVALFGGFLMYRGLLDKRAGDDRAAITNNNQNLPVNVVAPATPVPVNVNRPVNKVTPTPEPSTTPKAPPVVPSGPAIMAFVLPAPLRGASSLTPVRLMPDTQFADFTMGLESNDFVSYTVDLHPAGGASIWRVGHLKARGNKSLSLNAKVPAKLFRSQIYSFTVSGVKADGTTESIGDYSFRVMR